MTDKPSVLVTRRLPEAVESRLSRDYQPHFNAEDQPYDAAELSAKAAGCRAVLGAAVDRFDAQAIAGLPDCVEILATFSVGVDHIDLAAAEARGLIVTNTPDVLTDATADITLLLMLGAARRAYEGQAMLRADRWSGWAPTQLMGSHMTGKRLGILGMGRIGQAVAKRARAFDMEIHYCNRRRLAPELEAGAIFHEAPEGLLAQSDFLSLNSPATPETYHFINAERLALLPAGAIVINTARGTLVDDADLIAALKSGRIAAAGLDVFEGEPKIHPGYRELDNAYILPHMGSATVETRNAMGFSCLNNLDAHFAGREYPSRVV